MAVLSDKDIKELLKSGELVIEPLDGSQIQPASVDLRLGNEFRVFNVLNHCIIDPRDRNTLESATQLIRVANDGKFVLHPGDFVLATTLEKVRLPSYMVGRIDGRSSLGRLGIMVHTVAGAIAPGFEGRISLEMGNLGKLPVALYPGMRVCSVSFELTKSPAEVPYCAKQDAKYQGQAGPVMSKIFEEF